MTQKHLGVGSVTRLTGYSLPLRESKAGTQAATWKQERNQRLWRNAAYWFVPHSSLSLPFYTARNGLPKGGTPHNGLSRLASITNQESALQTWLQASWWKHFLSWSSFLPDDSRHGQVEKKKSPPKDGEMHTNAVSRTLIFLVVLLSDSRGPHSHLVLLCFHNLLFFAQSNNRESHPADTGFPWIRGWAIIEPPPPNSSFAMKISRPTCFSSSLSYRLAPLSNVTPKAPRSFAGLMLKHLDTLLS